MSKITHYHYHHLLIMVDILFVPFIYVVISMPGVVIFKTQTMLMYVAVSLLIMDHQIDTVKLSLIS